MRLIHLGIQLVDILVCRTLVTLPIELIKSDLLVYAKDLNTVVVMRITCLVI